MGDIDVAQLEAGDIDLINRACGGEYVVIAPQEGEAASWASELGALRSGNAPLLRETLMEQFGISTMLTGPDGQIFIVPKDPDLPCVEIQPGGAG